MSYKYVKYKVDERIAFITLNRPDKKNALNAEFVSELKQAFTTAADDVDAKMIILDAAGDVFSAGADLEYLQELQQNTYDENLADSTHLMELFKQIYEHPKVVVALIEGHAIAGGCGLAAVCDLSFSVEDVKMGYTEVKIGFIPAIVMVFLLRKIGEAKSKELLLSGKLISGKQAAAMGLINGTLAPEVIRKEVIAKVQKMVTSNSGESLKRTKQMMAAVQSMTLDDALTYAAKQNASARESEDCKKGISSFLHKSDLQW